MGSIDKYVYPGSDILINKFDCHNKAELEKLEALSTGANLAWLQLHPIRGEFDFQHLKDIHYFIFQDVYDWAGQVRTIDIGKNNLFCRTQFIDSYADSIFSCFFMDCYECREDKSNFITALTKQYADMNALHPFREGNGRAQREFARELCMECGYVLDLTETTHQEMLDASIASFNRGDNTGFISIFSRVVIPYDEYRNYQQKLNSTLLILSKDDM